MQPSIMTCEEQIRSRRVLLLILVVGALVRLPGLDRDLHMDEALSLFRAKGADVVGKIVPNGPEFTNDTLTRAGGWKYLIFSIQGEYGPPAYPLLLRGWIALVGESDAAVRLLSLVFGILTLVAIFYLSRMIFDERTAIVTTGLLALLPLHIQYSQEVRPYPLALLWTVLASGAYWRACRMTHRGEQWRWWCLYVLVAVAGLLTHFFTGTILLAHGIFTLFQAASLRREVIKRFFIATFAISALFTTWLLISSPAEIVKRDPLIRGFWSWETAIRFPALMFYFLSGYLPGVVFRSGFGMVLLGAYVLGAAVAIPLRRAQARRPALLFSLLLWGAPIAFILGLAAILGKAGLLTHPRYIIFSLTGLCLLMGAAISLSATRRLSLLMAAMLLGLSFHFQVKWYKLNKDPSTPWYWYGNISRAVAWVNQTAEPTALLLFDDGALALIWNLYEKRPVMQLLMDRRNFSLNIPRDFESKWKEVKRTYTSLHLVRRVGEPPSEIMNRLETSCRLLTVHREGRLEIRRYANQPPETPHHPLQEGKGPSP